MINPEVVKGEGELVVIQPEGCLSVKDVYGAVPRYPKIRVKAIDEQGREVRIKAEGFLSMLLQHEIDHTNGICFIDRIENDANAFYVLNEKGDLEPVAHDHVKALGIFRN